jgi:hypothetical protein
MVDDQEKLSAFKIEKGNWKIEKSRARVPKKNPQV